MVSRVFSAAELKSLGERERGNKKDANGLFYGRVKPKIKELLEVWFPQKNKLEKLIRKKGEGK